MDAGVGKIMDWVEDHGLEDDTVIIFASDNGMNLGQHGIWGKETEPIHQICMILL